MIRHLALRCVVSSLLLALLAASGSTAQTEAVRTESLAFDSRGATLRGTLYLPPGTGPFPAMVTVHGSGRTTRHDHFQQQIAQHFPGRGVAVFAYDKRGTGESSGEYPGSYGSSMVIYAVDALAAIAELTTRADIDGRRIGLWGISQAGWIIPIAAAVGGPQVAFTIIVSGPTVSIAEENLYSELTGDDQRKATGMSPAEIRKRMAAAAPLGLDAYSFIAEMRQPGLWLYGALDQSVPWEQGLVDLQALEEEWHRDFTWHVFDGANHG